MVENPAKTKVTALPGDGIGPEVMQATMRILEAANAPIDWEYAEAGAEVFKKGSITGVPRETLDSIARNGLALKSPLETPGRLRRQIRQCHLAQIFRALRQYPPGARTARRHHALLRPWHRHGDPSAKTSRTCMPASSTCRPPRSPNA